MSRATNIYRLGVKELWSLLRDPMMLVLIAWSFTASIYVAATAMPDSLSKATIAGSPHTKARMPAVFGRWRAITFSSDPSSTPGGDPSQRSALAE